MWPFSRHKVIPVLRFVGPIGMATPLSPGLALSTVSSAIDRAFRMSKTPAVAIVVNSPGGSPVQSHLIFERIRQLAVEKKKKVHVFCEDVAASGGYFLALAGDEIYADSSSIVGSIGVISQGFGLEDAIGRLGVKRRVYTAGTHKGALDWFRPEVPDDVAALRAILGHVHDVFIGVVKDRRLNRITAPDGDVFSGAFWAAGKALELGLIDGIGELRSRMKEIYGPRVRLRPVPMGRGGLLSRLRRGDDPGVDLIGRISNTPRMPLDLGSELVSAVEERALWARYGL